MSWSTEFETGLLDDFDLTITNSFFAPDAKYNDGNTLLLQWEGKTDNADVPETHVWFPLGKGWVSTDGGKTIHHDSGKADKYFVKSSLMAILIARCVNDFDIGDLLEARGNAFTSSVWQGMTFHMKSEVVDYGAGIDAKQKILPVRFVGAEGVSAPSSNGAAATTTTNGNGAGKVAAAKRRQQVIEIFRNAPDFNAGQDKALAEVDGITDDDVLLNSVMDESGLWTEVKAGV